MKREGARSAIEVSIRLFGQVEAILGDGVVARLPSRRSKWLLAVLALRMGRPIDRHTLAGTLWPESSDAGALHNLRQTLASLRRALGPAARAIANESPRSLVLKPSQAVWVDVHEFDKAIKETQPGDLERAIDFVRGPLVEGCDEPFAVEERGPRERLYVDALERVAARRRSSGEPRRAIDYLRRAVAADAYRESAWRELIAALAEAGDSAAALDTYRVLRRKLRAELRIEPDAQTVQLYRSIRSNTAGPPDSNRSRQYLPGRVRTPLNSLRGRKAEVIEVRSLVERCRLVTLSGVAGVGKTRLAVAVAEHIQSDFLDGVRLVELTPLHDSATVPSAIASALDIQEHPGHSVLETLVAKLADLHLLLVLDNCEHLTEGVALVVETLLSASPKLHVLATSRQSVGVVGEFVWRVPPLPIPEPLTPADCLKGTDRRESLLELDSVQLFLECSGWDAPRLPTPSLADLEAIGSICRRLDGIPLAIELAASRTSVLTPAQIEARLADRFTLLSRGSGAPDRHGTLRSAIKWSWDLLDDRQRELMTLLSVYRGGCTVEAIEATLPKLGKGRCALDLIASLVDRSLVVADLRDGEGRLSMLESIREFAQEQLQESKRLEATLDRHRDFFLEWAEGGEPLFNGPGEKSWFRRLEAEHDNLRAAIDWCHERHEHEKALRLAIALARFWDTHGHLSEGRERFEKALELISKVQPTKLEALGRLQAGWTATVQRDCDAARSHYERALRFFRDDDDEQGVAKTLLCLSTANYFAGDYVAAKLQVEEVLAIGRKTGRQRGIASALNNLGEITLLTGEAQAARGYLEESMATYKELGTTFAEDYGLVVCNLSLTAFRQGKHDEARTLATSALRLFCEGEVVVAIPHALNMFAVVSAQFGDCARAARLLGASEALSKSHSVPLGHLLDGERRAAHTTARRGLGESRFERELALGRQMTIGDVTALALETSP